MNATFAALSKPLEPGKESVLRIVARVAARLDAPFMVFGAFARDLHFFHAHGIEIRRVTTDVDISIQVKSWAEYERFAAALREAGFEPKSHPHPEKLVHRDTGQELDLLPFGEIADGGQVIWPTDDSPWSVLGFDEAFAHADCLPVHLDDGETAMVAVAPVPALVVLKLVAICDRPQRHKKDGTDISFIVANYLDIGNRPRLMQGEHQDILKGTGGDLDLASAELLGRDMGALLQPDTRAHIAAVLARDLESESKCFVVRGLIGRTFPGFPRARQAVEHLLRGVNAQA